jgi:MFS family permease
MQVVLPVGAQSSHRRVLVASLVGTTIEFFDFYIFAAAAVLVFPILFFPGGDPATAMLSSFATFAVAFFARPIGAIVFGHFGDRVGRKTTLVAALMTMGLSTVAIGLLPTYAQIGFIAPILLAVCRFGQGFGLGGEWGGAVLLAMENAPRGRKAWFGMFPQLGAPIGFMLSTATFIALTAVLSEADFLDWGWRIPFLASAILVVIGLWVRFGVQETPEFARMIARNEAVRVPFVRLCTHYKRPLFLGALGGTATFVIFYLLTVWALAWATSEMGLSRADVLPIQLIGVMFFAAFIPIAALLADRYGPLRVMILASLGASLLGFAIVPLFDLGLTGLLIFSALGFALMGCSYGPLSAALARPFPTTVRYTGASMAFNLSGILGASMAPSIATALARSQGLGSVGLYLTIVAAVTSLALWAMSRLKSEDQDD